jgi:chromosome partitioning protein
MTQFIAVGNTKGGVAKTTTCLSLGACLAEMEQTVLLIDLDPQANLALSLGFEPASLRRTVSDVVLHNATAVSAGLETSVMGLDLLPANHALAGIDKVLYHCQRYETYLKEALSRLHGRFYDYVLIDCAPALGPLTLNALTVAGLLIVPTQAEYLAQRSLEPVLGLVELVRQKTNPDLRYRILVTMYDRRNGICVRTLEQLRDAFAGALYETVIEVDTKLWTAWSPGNRSPATGPRRAARGSTAPWPRS